MTSTLTDAGIDRVAYPFTSRWQDTSVGRLHYVDEGRGDPILFVHGTPYWSFEWRHVVRALAAERRSIAVDLLGFGLSDRPRAFRYTPEAHAAVLREFVDALGLERFDLVVHDYGGPIALPLALDRPERIRRVVVINTWMWSLAGDRDMERAWKVAGGGFGRFLYKHVNLSLKVIAPSAWGDRRKLTSAIQRQYLERFPDSWSRGAVLWPLAHAIMGSDAYYRSLWEKRARLRSIPALVIWGMKDRAFRPQYLARWREVLPEAQVVELASAGHWPHEEEPEQVVAALRSFLAESGTVTETESASIGVRPQSAP
jgi:haloalkane dehalogenase